MSVVGVLRRVAAVILLVAVGVLAGYLVGVSASAGNTDVVHSQADAGSRRWYCSMHPQIIRDRPGLCPICEMELVPMPENVAAEDHPRELTVSDASAKLMNVQTSPVERKSVATEIRMVGKVQYDESRVKYIAAWVSGRLDRLFVDFTGTTVRQGDHLVSLYSPDLISAQAELLQAARTARKAGDAAPEYLADSAVSTLDAAREKLRLLGLTAGQIEEIDRSGEPLTHLTIYSPIGGVVIQKMASEGMYVQTGTQIYTVADLSQVWIKLDAYESDLAWIRYGQHVQFTTESYPGETFRGWISFLDPVLDPVTRTVKVRVEAPNPDGRLKPEMFVRAVVASQIAQGGRVMEPEMAGKWICPMHPSIVKSEEGVCDICGMDLVTTESLGYVAASTPEAPPLVIPDTAPLITGKRAVVYVRKPDAQMPTFEGREIELGPRAGRYYLVVSGLQAGEQVVTSGNFKIDSALQIQARPSMMNPQDVAKSSSVPLAGIEQKTCPVMEGNPIDPSIFVEYKGKRVYFCCRGCDKKFLADPEKYIVKLPQFQKQGDPNE
ncbi:MAG TPA: efflux RND transporter periplasmic adaptor subunit [Sedimentisphaerales bacterium]|jgi:Cu(I)/Ag(I) efflux system membrane fusion protein|nr:efflux RND transporter periplasmic adaptor subunit [Sedimentisphaerales bacterium]HNU30677.1 efflux RND transporter periplasmic adaptor subunit [Sedimentisphaerales bacterium]